MAETSWYALFHDSNYHKSLVGRIEGLGVEVFSPERVTLQPRSYRPSPQRYKVLLFPGYLFLRFDWEKTHPSSITAFNGAYGLVRFGDNPPMVIPDEVIEDLRESLEARQKELDSKRPVVISQDPVRNAISFLVQENSSAARSAGMLDLLRHIDSSNKSKKRSKLVLSF